MLQTDFKSQNNLIYVKIQLCIQLYNLYHWSALLLCHLSSNSPCMKIFIQFNHYQGCWLRSRGRGFSPATMSAGSRPWDIEIMGRGGCLGAVSKTFFSALWASVWCTNTGRGRGKGPRAPPLDIPLKKNSLVIESPTHYLHLPNNLIFTNSPHFTCTHLYRCSVDYSLLILKWHGNCIPNHNNIKKNQ